MVKKKQEQTPVEKQPEESTPKKHSVVKLLTWLVLLAILTGGSITLYDALIHQDAFTDVEVFEDPATEVSFSGMLAAVEQPEPTAEEAQPEPVPVQEIVPPQPETTIAPVMPEPVVPAPQLQSKKIKPNYSLAQALALRDAVHANKNCRELIEELMHVENKTPLMEQIVTALLPQCLNDLKDNISTFKAQKKQAILSIFRQKYSAYTAYLVALPWLLMDIHQVNPTGDTPMDTLDRLQNALYTNNTEAALKELEALPPATASIFNNLRRQLISKQESTQLLDKLVLSFVEGE